MKRLEDGRLLRGSGQFIDDLAPEGLVHVALLRSPIANNVSQIGDITFLVTFALTAALYYAFDMISPRKATAGSRAA